MEDLEFAVFLQALKFAEEGTKILFDDYTDRPHYHFREIRPAVLKNVGGNVCL